MTKITELPLVESIPSECLLLIYDSSRVLGDRSVAIEYKNLRLVAGQVTSISSIPLIEIDLSVASNFKIILQENIEIAFINATSGAAGTLILQQDNVGGRQLSYSNSKIKTSNGNLIELSTTANAKDILEYFVEDINNIHLSKKIANSKEVISAQADLQAYLATAMLSTEEVDLYANLETAVIEQII